MALFKKRSTDPEELERLKAEIAIMSARLEASDQAKHQLDSTVQHLVTRLDTPISPPPTEPPPAPTPTIDPAEIDKLNAKLQRLTVRIDDVDAAAPVVSPVDPADVARLDETMQRISSRIDEIDGRITSIATELANQITEISGDIDAIGGNQPAPDEFVDELRDAQTRLAGEQARYQIAFRQDLAELADRLKRA